MSLPTISPPPVYQKAVWLIALDAIPVFLRPRYSILPNSTSSPSSSKRPRTTWWLRHGAMIFLGFWWWYYCSDSSVSFVGFIIPLILRRLMSQLIATTWPSLLLGSSTSSEQPKKNKNTNATTAAPTTRNTWSQWLSVLAHGPLGHGASKLVTAVVGMTIYSQMVPRLHSNEEDDPPLQETSLSSLLLHHCQVGPLWPAHAPWLPLLVGGVAFVVNAVLWVWSTVQHTKGNHSGVDHMVAGSTHRALTTVEHIRYLTWAAVNAACEEIIYRGLFRGDFYAILKTQRAYSDDMNHILLWTNLVQATSFGLAHYYGIPSGWTGVGLTWVYGCLMGVVADAGRGLFWPTVAHTIADYYIFVTIARRKLE